MIRIAIDTGGTFTDCVYLRDGQLAVLKVRSTPDNPADAVLQAIRESAGDAAVEVRLGTTVGTNALLERKGARVAFVTTEGFEDTIEIGRQARPKLYDLLFRKQPGLVSKELRFGARERTSSVGVILRAPSAAEVNDLTERIRRAAPESIAISLLFSFANPANEKTIVQSLRELGVPLSVSHELLPEFREYERGSTIVINAYLAPKIERYLAELDNRLSVLGGCLQVMQSSGGIVPARIALSEPVRTILSGPAGGVVGALQVAREAGFQDILTFDMGGTSTDVALLSTERGLATTSESQIDGMPVAVPMLNIHTVGAGGGSIARFDQGGALQVGPQSAGSIPGPICYGRGEQPTVTDANLILGRIDPDHFLGGAMRLAEQRAREHFERGRGSVATSEGFAEGIIRLANAHMSAALRKISIEQGYDPRGYVLVSFGGAGPLHACELARSLRIPTVLVPHAPGALSAYGILISDVVRDYSRTVMAAPDDATIASTIEELRSAGEQELASEGLVGTAAASVDVRYAGQAYELNVPWFSGFQRDFHSLHEQRYGYADETRSIEVVNARVRIVCLTEPLAVGKQSGKPGDAGRAVLKQRPIYYGGKWHDGLLYDRERLGPGDQFSGPAVVAEYSATTFVPPEASVTVDAHSNLIVQV